MRLVTLALAALLAADPPMTAVKVAGSSSQVELRNTGTQPINAWVFVVSTPNANGGIHRVVYASDVYMSEVTLGLQGAEAHLTPIGPNDARAVPVDPLPATAMIQVLAAVFDDNGAAGDEQTIASIFQKRAAERDELKTVVDTFGSVLAGLHGVAALQSLQQRFAVSAGPAESTPHRSARESVSAWLQRGSPASDDEVDRALQSYVAFVTRQYEVASRRAIRR